MPFVDLILLWSAQYTVKRLLCLLYEEYKLLDVDERGRATVMRKVKMYEEMAVQELEKEKERVEEAFKQLPEWKGSDALDEGKAEGKDALGCGCSDGKEPERGAEGKGKEGGEGAGASTEEPAHATGTGVQGKSITLLASLSSWFCESKVKTE